eukprot:gene10041-18679_t
MKGHLMSAEAKIATVEKSLKFLKKEFETEEVMLSDLGDTMSIVLQERRLRFVGHCWRRKDKLISKLLLWQPTQSQQKPGRPCITYMDQLLNDTGLDCNNIKRVMENREEWKKLVKDVRGNSN